jgi:hypothetical protein
MRADINNQHVSVIHTMHCIAVTVQPFQIVSATLFGGLIYSCPSQMSGVYQILL